MVIWLEELDEEYGEWFGYNERDKTTIHHFRFIKKYEGGPRSKEQSLIDLVNVLMADCDDISNLRNLNSL